MYFEKLTPKIIQVCMVCKNRRYWNMNVKVDLYSLCFGMNSQNDSCDCIKNNTINKTNTWLNKLYLQGSHYGGRRWAAPPGTQSSDRHKICVHIHKARVFLFLGLRSRRQTISLF